ncbi:pericentrin-like isoform X2 [Anopheles albimanus]|uniref:pericentrin-like isoform X2 n=1 Tax=Anopheles albimanus TaxID=7167 RepID=UPI001640FD56|nr:pericentrin-like isoform X2 [Anopheles albimanus]
MNRLKLQPLKKLQPSDGSRTAADEKEAEDRASGLSSASGSRTTATVSRGPGGLGPLNTVATAGASSKSSSSYGSHTSSKSSVRFRLEDEILGSSSGTEELSTGSATASDATGSPSANDNHDDDSLEIMEEIVVPADDDDGGGSSSVRSVEEGTGSDREASGPVPVSAGSSSAAVSAVAVRKRQLFDIGGDDDLPGGGGLGGGDVGGSGGLYDIDRLQLSASDIAQHFKPESLIATDSDRSEEANSEPLRAGVGLAKSAESSLKVDSNSYQDEEDEYSIDQVLNDIESGEEQPPVRVSQRQSEVPKVVQLAKGGPHAVKELSPLKEDDVLINDLKVNLNTFQPVRSASRPNRNDKVMMMAESANQDSPDNSLNTTNDISDLAKDTESERVASVELEEMDSGQSAGGGDKQRLADGGRSRSVEETVIKANSGSNRCASLGPIKITDERVKRNTLPAVTDDPSSSSSSGGVPEDLREKILSTSKSFEEVKAQGGDSLVADKVDGEKPKLSEGGGVKQMERVTGESKEALEDISEESEHTVERDSGSTDEERLTRPQALLEKGKEMRTILEENLLHQKRPSVGSTIDEDNKENIPEGGSLKLSIGGGGVGTGGYEFESVVSVKMFQTMENEVRKLQEMVATKDILLEEAYTRTKDGSRMDSLLREQQQCRSANSESVSLTTNSTEYRPIPGELDATTALEKDLHGKIMERNQWIELLSDKLRESIQQRNQLQADGDKLTMEVLQLKKQLSEAVESMKQKTQWPVMTRPDQESTSGQRISEISIDLVSETEEEGLSDFPDVYDEQVPQPHGDGQTQGDMVDLNPMHIPLKISKQLDQFRRYLLPEEVRLFNMVQTKFEDFLRQELERGHEAGESENRLLREQLAAERSEKEQETNRLRQMLGSVKAGSIVIDELRNELESRHTQEMADLRTYFEKKVAELEKHYSEEVFSQQSRRLSNDETASDISGAEEFPEENGGYQSKHTSPRRKHKEDIYLSPTHRKITPTSIDATDMGVDEVLVVEMEEAPEISHLSKEELKEFYQSKIRELKQQHERVFATLHEKLRAYEVKEQEKQFISNQTASNITTMTTTTTTNPTPSIGTGQEHCSPLLTNAPPEAPAKQDLSVAAVTTGADAQLTNSSATNPTQQRPITPAEPPGSADADLQEIIAGYERRLQEQVALARQDVLKELEVQIQALLSDASFEDSHWPPELVLLREKFTAKSQLEVAQLQLKHEEEMARMKNDFEKQLQRKLKRHTTFDSTRGLDKIINERDNLRELSSTLRNVLGSLAKCFSICEEDLNATVLEELQRYQQQQQAANVSLGASASADESQLQLADCTVTSELNLTDLSFLSSCKLFKFAPDVSGIISIIDDPSLVEYVTTRQRDGDDPENVSLNLEECMDRLKAEALSLLALSERLRSQNALASTEKDNTEPQNKVSEKNDSCEEEDGLKRTKGKPAVMEVTRSFDEHMVREVASVVSNASHSLPGDLAALQVTGELNLQLHELKNRLVKAEDERKLLEHELAEARSKQNSLVSELSETKQHLLELNSQRVEFSEGYGTNALLPTAKRTSNSFVELQERAKAMLSSTAVDSSNATDQTVEGHSVLLQMVEDFCREGERYMEDGKRDRLDLQLQIEAADKQLKATRQFLEDQAAEREQERDEFVKEIERLRGAIREKDKERVNFERTTKEEGCGSNCRFAKDNVTISAKLESAEQQMKELTTQIAERDERVRKMEADLKDSIDKGFTLREIIAELETQIESKTINEHVLETKVKELEKYIDVQNRQNESLQQDMESFKADMLVRGYDEKIAKLEEELRQRQPSAEQGIVLEALIVQLHDIEETLERKTKNLETLNSTSGASLGCSSPSEDISVNQDSPLHRKRKSASSGGGAGGEGGTGGDEKRAIPPLPVDEVQRIFDKLHRHSRIEDVAIKRINDLEMQITNIRSAYAELQHERDVLQEKMSEQSLKISTLQTKLDEQRLRAEELHRQGTSQLTVKVHDLQNELQTLKETLQSRDKQIVNLKQYLENSQQAIARQEKELAMTHDDHAGRALQDWERLEAELRAKEEEVRLLKERIKNEMISKAALPDLMETMLADKNEEIDQLKERLAQYQHQQQLQHQDLPAGALQQLANEPANMAKDDDGGRTLSDVVSITDYDESDMVMRRIPEQSTMGGIMAAHSIPMDSGGSMHPNHSKQSSIPLAGGGFLSSHDSSMMNSIPLRSNFFHDVCSAVPRLPDQGRNSAPTPEYVPRQINFSLAEETSSPQLIIQRQSAPVPALMFCGTAGAGATAPRPIVRTENQQQAVIEEIFDAEYVADVGAAKDDGTAQEEKIRLESEVESLKLSLDRVVSEKNEMADRLQAELQEKIEKIADLQVELAARNQLYEELMQEKRELRDEVEKVKQELNLLDQQSRDLQQKDADLKVALDQLQQKERELSETKSLHEKVRLEMESVTKESNVLRTEQQRQKQEIDTLRQQIDSLNRTIGHKDELMGKLEKDLLNYSKNEEKYLEQLRSLDAKETELKIVQGNYKDRLHEIEILNEDNRFLTEDITRLKNEIARSSSSLNSNSSYVQALKQSCTKLEEELQDTKVLLTEKMLALERVKIDLSGCQREVEDLRSMLKEKDMIIQQIGDDGNSLHEALSNIQQQMQQKNVTLSGALRDEQARNAQLQAELERLRIQQQRSDNSSSPKPFSVEEIAVQLEKELNYSAQLDSSILKAIESDDVNSDDGREEEERDGGRKGAVSRKPSELDELRKQLRQEMDRGKQMQELLEAEKANSATIQQQDADIIEAMRVRLEAALGNESTLQRLLEEERSKNERLSRMVGGLQRTKSFDNYLLMKGGKSPQESPSRRLNRSNEFEAEMVGRYEAELKFLTAQNARERERTADLQRVLERERERFEKEITDRTEHGEQVKKELNRITKEKESLELELDHEQEKLELAHKELESLEKRIGALQEAESLRSARRERTSGPNSLEYQELKLRLESVEFERNQLRDTVSSLRSEVDRRRTREAHLTEALSREHSLNAQNQSHPVVPEEFLNKLKDLNRMLEANARENHQQAESLRFMMEERRALQMRIQELERYNGHSNGHHYQREDLEERANHLFGKYLRSESHRKALVHQKRYLQIVLTTYEENEARALALLNAQLPPGQLEVLALASGPRSLDSTASRPSRRKSFRSIVTVVVAIERMKYLVRKWHGGRRVCAKAIFSQPFTPRRSQSARTNVWARSANSHFAEYSTEADRAPVFRTEHADPQVPQLFGSGAPDASGTAAGGSGAGSGSSGGNGAFIRTLTLPMGSSPSSLRMNVEVMETLREHQHPQYGNR